MPSPLRFESGNVVVIIEYFLVEGMSNFIYNFLNIVHICHVTAPWLGARQISVGFIQVDPAQTLTAYFIQNRAKMVVCPDLMPLYEITVPVELDFAAYLRDTFVRIQAYYDGQLSTYIPESLVVCLVT
jgi:hypothetical protein